MKIPDSLVEELDHSIATLEKIAMERDDDRAHVFDLADEDRRYEDGIQLEREQETYDALEEAVAKGLSKKSLIVLARETGMCTWAMKQSLKG